MAKPAAYITNRGKAVRAAVLENYAKKSDESKQLSEDGEGWSQGYTSRGLKEPLYPPGQLTHLLELNTYHARCVKTKARESAGLGWSLKPIEGKAEDEVDEAQKLIAEEFFKSLSEPIISTLYPLMLDYESVGYGALEVTATEDGTPIDVTHIPATTIRAHKDKKRFEHRRNNSSKVRWYRSIKEIDDERIMERKTVYSAYTGETAEEFRERTGEELPFKDTANDLMWFRNYTPASDYYGLPDVMPALGAIHGELSRRDYNIAFFDNYGIPAMAVFVSGDFDPGPEIVDTMDKDEYGVPIEGTGRTALEDALEQMFGDLPEHPWSTIVMTLPSRETPGDKPTNVEVRLERLSTEVKEASFRLYRQDNRDEVIHSHGVPPYRIGINETGSLGGNTATESTEIYKRAVLEPLQNMLEDQINTYILQRGLGVQDWEWKLDEIDLRDETADLNRDTSLFDRGALSPNELRERSGLKRVEGIPAMDSYFIAGKPIDALPAAGEEEGDGEVPPEGNGLNVETTLAIPGGNGANGSAGVPLLQSSLQALQDLDGGGVGNADGA